MTFILRVLLVVGVLTYLALPEAPPAGSGRRLSPIDGDASGERAAAFAAHVVRRAVRSVPMPEPVEGPRAR